MWRSEREQCQAIGALLSRVNLGRLWTDAGPTDEAHRLLEDDGGPLSHGQIVMLRVAYDLWNGCGKATVDDLVSVLDGGNLRAVATLLLELAKPLGPDVAGWLERAGGRE